MTSATCTACGRTLTGARAVRRGYGWRCYAKVLRAARVLEGSGNAAAQRAAEALLQGAYVKHPHRKVWSVVSSDGQRTYLTHPDGCTCAAGLHQVLCYHRAGAAVLAA